MNEKISFLIKIIVSSFLLSLVIKYLAPYVSISSSNINALIIVMILPLIITIFLSKKLWDNVSDS